MRLVVPALFALATCLVAEAAFSSTAAAQVVISGQVTSYSTTEAPPPGPAPSGYVAAGGAPAPTRYVHRSAAMPALWVPGLIALAGGWAINVFGLAYAFQTNMYIDWYGFGVIPVIGTWLQFLAAGPQFPEWSIATGIIQDAGLILLILGMTIREEWDEPVYTFNEADPYSPTLDFAMTGAPGGGAMATLTLTHF